MKQRKGPKPRPPIDRFLEKISPAENGCWNWVGSVKAIGYGSFGAGPRSVIVYAHRWSYEFFVGPIPTGLQIDHLCRNRRCVNPDHLEAVTRRENLMRGEGPAARNARKTHCSRGHEFTPDNTIKSGRGKRCRICHNARRRRT